MKKETAKKSTMASFVQGKKPTKTPTPKSLTPKVSAKGDKARAGKYGKSLKG